MSASNQKTQSARQGKSEKDAAQHAGPKKQPGQGGTGHGAMSPNAHKGQGEKNTGGKDGGGKNN